MEITTENISIVVNVILIPSVVGLAIYIQKNPKFVQATSHVKRLLSILYHVNRLVTIAEQCLQDDNLSPEETAVLMATLKDLVNAIEVKNIAEATNV